MLDGMIDLENILETTLDCIKSMVNADTVVGSPIECPDGTVVIPISKVGVGYGILKNDISQDKFGKSEKNEKNEKTAMSILGIGAVNVRAIAFLVVGKDKVHLFPIGSPTDSILGDLQKIVNRVAKLFTKKPSNYELQVDEVRGGKRSTTEAVKGIKTINVEFTKEFDEKVIKTDIETDEIVETRTINEESQKDVNTEVN